MTPSECGRWLVLVEVKAKSVVAIYNTLIPQASKATQLEIGRLGTPGGRGV